MFAKIRKWLDRRKSGRMAFYERTSYSFDGVAIRADDPLGENRVVEVCGITDISVETNCLGPFAEDVFWLINRGEEEIRIPQCSPVFSELMTHFESLEGFDWGAFTSSMSSTDDALFACWSRPPDESKEPNPTLSRPRFS